MLIAWQTQGDLYRGPFTKSLEAVYAGSEIKSQVEAATDRVAKKYPVPSAIAPIAYSIGVKRSLRITSDKLTLIPNTVTTYQFDQKNQAGSIGVTWRF